MSAVPPVNLDDTSRCGRPWFCENCGRQGGVETATIDTPTGRACAPLCEVCADQHALPRWSWSQAARRVADHCEHLGIDLDTAAAIWEAGGDAT